MTSLATQDVSECGEPTLELVGNATTVLRLGPFTLLTDPNFLHRGQRAYLGKGLFSKRLTEPALQPQQLPDLDGVVLSHLHGDHFDRIARRELDRGLPVFTTPAASKRLHKWGFSAAAGMKPWETIALSRQGHGLTITSTPGTHAPSLAKGLLPPVMGTVLEHTPPGGRPLRVYITGDTLYRGWLRQVTDRLGGLDAMVIHLGGTRALGILVTMDAEQGASLVDLLRPSVTVPVHHEDYTVFRSSLADFQAAWRARRLPGELRVVDRGSTVSLVPG